MASSAALRWCDMLPPVGFTGQIGRPNSRKTLWSPSLISTSLWLDSLDASTLTVSGANVSQWSDKSGNARHVSQGTSTQQPLYDGSPGLIFDGSNDFLQSTASITSGTYSGAFTLIYAATRTKADGGCILTERTTALAGSFFWTGTSPYYISSDGTNAASNTTISQSDFNALSTSGGIVVHQHLSGARDTLLLNGSEVTVTAGTGSNITGANGFRVGRREGTNTNYWGGRIYEIIAVAETLSASTRETLEGYLAHKYNLAAGLPAQHPYKTSPPYI